MVPFSYLCIREDVLHAIHISLSGPPTFSCSIERMHNADGFNEQDI